MSPAPTMVCWRLTCERETPAICFGINIAQNLLKINLRVALNLKNLLHAYRTNHDRTGPTVTGTTSLTSTVKRNTLRTV